jgi:hypothetical protein
MFKYSKFMPGVIRVKLFCAPPPPHTLIFNYRISTTACGNYMNSVLERETRHLNRVEPLWLLRSLLLFDCSLVPLQESPKVKTLLSFKQNNEAVLVTAVFKDFTTNLLAFGVHETTT